MRSTMDSISLEIRQFIVQNFLFGDDQGLQNDTSFMQSGIIDSTGILELVNYIEQTHGIRIQDDELIPENLDSIDNLHQFLQKKVQCVE